MEGLSLIHGTQLIVHQCKVYKLKLNMPSVVASDILWQEAESVLRALLYNHGSEPVCHIQTQHLLCDCKIKRWKTGKLLSFKQNGESLACPGLEFSINAVLKTSTLDNRQKASTPSSSQIKSKLGAAEKGKARADEGMHINQPMEQPGDSQTKRVCKDSASGDARNTTPSSSKEVTGKTGDSRQPNAKDISSNSVVIHEVPAIDKRKFYSQCANTELQKKSSERCETKRHSSTENQPRKEDRGDEHKQKAIHKDQKQNVTLSQLVSNINQSSNKTQILQEDNKKYNHATKRNHLGEPKPTTCVPKQSRVHELSEFKSINKATMDFMEKEEERKLQNLADCEEREGKRGWLGRTWEMVLTPVKAVFGSDKNRVKEF